MANTGVLTYTELIQVIPPCPVPCTPTGEEKPNVSSDPDYIAPAVNLDLCPIDVSLDCPSYTAATGRAGGAEAAVTVFNSVLSNPSVAAVVVKIMNGVTEVNSTTFTLPHTSGNYFYANWTGLASGSRTIAVDYLDGDDNVLATCTNLATITIT